MISIWFYFSEKPLPMLFLDELNIYNMLQPTQEGLPSYSRLQHEISNSEVVCFKQLYRVLYLQG